MNIKLGNIISEQEIINKDDIINYYIEYNDIRDNILPTLIVGWKLTKQIFGENTVSILNKKIKDNLFWTFNKEERQIDYDKDVEEFINLLPKDFIKNLKYRPMDLFINKLFSIEDIINYIFYSSSTGEKRNITSYYSNNKDMLYFFYVNSILGFTLESVDFLQINKEKLLNEIKINSQLFITEENKEIEKCFGKLEGYFKCIPYLVNKFQ